MFGTRNGPARCAAVLLAVLSACSDVTRPVEVTSVDVVAPANRVEVGKTIQLAATAVGTGGAVIAEGAQIEWSSSDTAVASVDAGGLVTGRAVGTAAIRASAGGETGSVEIEVVAVPVASVVVAPGTATLAIGQTRRLAATPLDAAGAPLGDRGVEWSSDDAAVATVAADGTVTAQGAGTATITAASGGRKGTAVVTVPAVPLPQLRLEEVASGFFPSPSHLASIPGDERLFVVGVGGQVWVVKNGQVLPELFLDLRAKLRQEAEQGLFSLAFHPRFASNGYFYVNYADRDGDIRIERYTAGRDADRADPASGKLILLIDHPPTGEHFGGELAFGPDGRLYVGVGDGGHGHDRNAQDRGSLLGKILRIDVDAGDPYAIPADNPFVGQAGSRGEIWAVGLRNPWRMSFDHAAGLLYVADVGETHWEEVNVVPANRGGLNYGWNDVEGSHCYPAGETGCNRGATVIPVVEYPHPGTPGEAGSVHPSGCSVTGGYVYRGSAIPALRGHYFYGDLCRGWVRSFRYRNGRATEQRQYPFAVIPFLVTLGQDAAGELYALPYTGVVYRIAPVM